MKILKTASLLLLLTLGLAGCGKGAKTVLEQGPGFSVAVPKGYTLDGELNPNDATTSTWFRADRRALFAIDVQPLAGERRDRLIELGKRTYLEKLSRELEVDLGTHLPVFRDFESEVSEIAGEPALEATFVTDKDGQELRGFLLVSVTSAEPPREVMLDYRLPENEAAEDKVWLEILKSVSWKEEAASPSPSASASASPKATPEGKHKVKASPTPPPQASRSHEG